MSEWFGEILLWSLAGWMTETGKVGTDTTWEGLGNHFNYFTVIYFMLITQSNFFPDSYTLCPLVQVKLLENVSKEICLFQIMCESDARNC